MREGGEAIGREWIWVSEMTAIDEGVRVLRAMKRAWRYGGRALSRTDEDSMIPVLEKSLFPFHRGYEL